MNIEKTDRGRSLDGHIHVLQLLLGKLIVHRNLSEIVIVYILGDSLLRNERQLPARFDQNEVCGEGPKVRVQTLLKNLAYVTKIKSGCAYEPVTKIDRCSGL